MPVFFMADKVSQTAVRFCITCLTSCADARLRAVKNLWKPLKWAGALVVMAVGIAGIAVLRFAGAFRSLEPAFAGICNADRARRQQ